MALKAFTPQPGVDVGGGVPLLTREKKCRQGKENGRGEDSHAQVLPSIMAEAKYTVLCIKIRDDRGLVQMTVAMVGVAILVISTVGAILWVNRSGSDKQRQTKLLLFALYFWILAFIQLILSAVGYSVLSG